MDIYSSSEARLHPFVAELFRETYTTKKETKEVLDLAMAIDKAIDVQHECGTSVTEKTLITPVKFEELWILAAATFIRKSRKSTTDYSDIYIEEAAHNGWVYTVIHGQEFQTPEEFQYALEDVALPFWLNVEELCPPDEESEYTIAAEAYHRWREKSK